MVAPDIENGPLENDEILAPVSIRASAVAVRHAGEKNNQVAGTKLAMPDDFIPIVTFSL